MTLRMRAIERRARGGGYGIVGKLVDESDAQRVRRVELFGGEEHLQRAALADEPGQALRASPAGHQSERGAAMSEDRVGRGDTAGAGERQVEAAAHAVSRDG